MSGDLTSVAQVLLHYFDTWCWNKPLLQYYKEKLQYLAAEDAVG